MKTNTKIVTIYEHKLIILLNEIMWSKRQEKLLDNWLNNGENDSKIYWFLIVEWEMNEIKSTTIYKVIVTLG